MTIVLDRTVAITNAIRREALKRLEKAAELVAKKAKLNVPVDTGALKRSIHTEIDEENLVARIVADALRKTPSKSGPLSYAYYVETGEGSGPAQPYLRPALHSSTDEIERIFT